jgi:hypothetical protein
VGIHVLRSERLGTLWCGVAVLACLSVEGWRLWHPQHVEPLVVGDVLDVLAGMPGPTSSDDLHHDVGAIGSQTLAHGRRFLPADRTINVAELDSAGWNYWGLSPRQAQAAVRYNHAVGGIQDARTLRRMRVLPEGWFDHFAPSVQYKEPTQFESVGSSALRPEDAHLLRSVPGIQERELLEINAADSLALLSVKGIGPWVTGRILTARRLWGGFAETSQLADALGGWDSLATVLTPLLTCDPGFIKLRCADTLSLEQWRTLPGIDAKTAQVLQRHVRHHGGEPHQVLAHPLLDSTQSSVLSHYLCPCSQD